MICGNCATPLEQKSSKKLTILSSWNKECNPHFISIYEALSVLFEIPPLTLNNQEKKDRFLRGSKFTSGFSNYNDDEVCAGFYDNDSDGEDEDVNAERWGLCNNCWEILTVLYNNFQEFTAVSRAESEVGKILKELELYNQSLSNQKQNDKAQSRRQSTLDEDPDTIVKTEPVDRSDGDSDSDGADHFGEGNDNVDYDLNASSVSIKQAPVTPPADTFDDNYNLDIGAPSPESPDPDTQGEDKENAATKRKERSKRASTNFLPNDYVEFSSDSDNGDQPKSNKRLKGKHEVDDDDYIPPASPSDEAIHSKIQTVHSGSATFKQLKCPQCEKVFLHENVLICHRRIIHRENISISPPTPIPHLPFFQISESNLKKAVAESAGKKSTCPVCRLEVPRNEIRDHLSSHTRSLSRPWMCTICGKQFQNHEDLMNHARTHQTCVPCNHCGRRVPRLEMLTHLRFCGNGLYRKGGRPSAKAILSAAWNCKLCKVRFTNRSRMLAHMETHKQKKAYSCKICNKTFQSITVQRLHVKRFHRNNESGPPSVRSVISADDDGGDDFQNDYFPNNPSPREGEPLGPPAPPPPKKSVKKEVIVPEDPSNITPILDERFKCKGCNFQCQESTQMENHLRVEHATVDTLTCNICNRKLQDEYCLNLHLNSHSETKPLKCYVCNKTYSVKNSFYFHLKERHSLDTKTIVLKYPLIFTFTKSPGGVRIKGQKIHSPPKKGEFPCEQCGKVFQLIHSLRNHQKIVHEKVREFICSYCGKCFPRRSYFLLHEKLHTSTETPYKCHLCNKGFRLPGNLRMHLQSTIHNPTKSFICETCGKGFNRRDNLRLHVKAVHLKLQTRKPRSSTSEYSRTGRLGRRRVYGTDLENLQESNNSYIPNLPNTSTSSSLFHPVEPIPSTSSTSHIQNFQGEGPKPHKFDLDASTFEDNSSQISNESRSSVHTSDSQGIIAGQQQQHQSNILSSLGLQLPNFALPHHSHSQPHHGQSIMDAALQFAHQAEFQNLPQQQPFNLRGSQNQYR